MIYPQEQVDKVGVERLAWGLILGAAAGGLGWWAGALSISGAAAAALVGTLTFGFGGWQAAGLLIAFFVSSSALSRLAKARKQIVEADFAKGGRRDWGQVLANGGLAAALAVAYGVQGNIAWAAGLMGALAAVNADTWGTELGVLSRRTPHLITTGQPVRPGVSGGVTLEGLLASMGGAALIAALGSWWWADESLLIAGLVGGMVGSTVDSLLGASLQAMYYCPNCEKETERHPAHICGALTRPLRGWPWLNNDVVNLLASSAGAILAAAWIVLIAAR